MAFLKGMKNYFMELIDENVGGDSVRWASVSSQFEELLLLLEKMNTQANHTTIVLTPAQIESERDNINTVTKALTELVPILEQRRILYGNDPALFYHLRLLLLRMWRIILRIVKSFFYQKRQLQKQNEAAKAGVSPSSVGRADWGPRFPAMSMNDLSVLFRSINAFMVRQEFSMEHLKIDRDGVSHCQEPDLGAAKRYRVLLINTQAAAQDITNFHVCCDPVASI
jgi:hypothetical protein